MAKETAKKVQRYKGEGRWDKLDNTANLFPVIATTSSSNVFRVAVNLKEEVDGETLQKAVDQVLPYFDMMRVRMKRGIFWRYFEDNPKKAPKVWQEDGSPCQYINPLTNNEYQFRVGYYGKRICVEVFHVLTDGNGALLFLKEIMYHYLRMKHPELDGENVSELQEETSVSREDSYVKNYKRPAKASYKTEKALVIKGDMFPKDYYGVMHGYMNLAQVKQKAKDYGVTVNQYLLGVYAWAVYNGYLHNRTDKHPLTVCVPVNLRPYFGSATSKNFFAVVTAIFRSEREDYTFEEVLGQIATSLNEQITKEHLEEIMAYNVANEKNPALRKVPLFIKDMAMHAIYKKSANANSGCITNLGLVKVAKPYEDYVNSFYALLSMSPNQNMKAGVISYKNTLVFSFSAAVRETDIQREFFRKIAEDGIEVSVETNGVYDE